MYISKKLKFPLLYLRGTELVLEEKFPSSFDEAPFGLYVEGLIIARECGTMGLVESVTYPYVKDFLGGLTFQGKRLRLPCRNEYRLVGTYKPRAVFEKQVERLNTNLNGVLFDGYYGSALCGEDVEESNLVLVYFFESHSFSWVKKTVTWKNSRIVATF